VLVRSDRQAATEGSECNFGAEPADDAAGSRRGGAARARDAAGSDSTGRSLLLRHDCHRSRRRPKSLGLVYVAARAPDAGEDYTALAKQFPAPPASAGIVWSDDWGQLSEEAFLRDFAGDLPADKARVLYAVQALFKRTLLAGKTTHAAWRSKPSWYAVSTEDRTIDPDLQRFMAKRMGAKARST